MEVQDRSRSPSRRTSRVEQVVGRWLRRSRDLGSRSHSLSRDRVEVDGKPAEPSYSDQKNYPFRFNVQIQRDPTLGSHGLTLTSQTPILVQEVTPGGPADGRLLPGDRLVKINKVAVDDLTPEQAAEVIRECQESLTMTVLRTILGPKSSFITPEKRAKLRSNPVKVHFAEEVEVNGQSQGNSLLFLPNVLKVYLENGQTKAFKFEPSTTVKDIVMTLKEKLSLSRIEHFSLVLEQQHSITKLLLLHDEERIQQVVQKKEAHNYRCLFRVAFMPRNLQTLLQDDPVTFLYLYLQGVNDVLQERFAVEMRCNTALRLAALHIQERLASCGQSTKTNLKIVTKTWGIENFVSSTLLRNMREKDLRKAIAYHMKKSQSQHDPKQKGLSVDQARINYLEELSDLKSFGGKSFSATMMLQDRESMVTLLVGASYGVSQVVNHKLGILSNLTEFTSITRIELLPESDKVSLVKIYLHDIKPITLLLESVAAKDMSCLIAGYCRVFVDPNLNVFPWTDESKKHRVSAEEGYVSRCGSDSDNSSDLDTDRPGAQVTHDNKPRPRVRSSSDPEGRKKKERDRKRSEDGKEDGHQPCGDKKQKEKKDVDTENRLQDLNRNGKNENTERKEEAVSALIGQQVQVEIRNSHLGEGRAKDGEEGKTGSTEKLQAAEEHPSMSEASDSLQSDSRVLTSPSSDSLDALEEDDLMSCSSSSIQGRLHIHSPLQLHPHPERHIHPHLLTPPPTHSHPLIHLITQDRKGRSRRGSGDGADPQLLTPVSPQQGLQQGQKPLGDPCSDDSSMCFAELSRLVDFLPSPPEASEDDEDEEVLLRRRTILKELDGSVRRVGEGGTGSGEGSVKQLRPSPSPSSPLSHMDFVFNFNQDDARCYYKLCSNITPDSAHSLPCPTQPVNGENRKGGEGEVVDLDLIPILQPPPGFGDSSSDEEFFDARDRFTSPEETTSGSNAKGLGTEVKLDHLSILSLSDIRVSVMDADKDGKTEEDRKEEDKIGMRETLFQLRKRSRKRRSFMETDYTSLVSYPEPDPESQQDPVFSRSHKTILAGVSDAQMLSSDPEPSEQTENPSPTVSSLTHAEGEPAQLETKPILSKTCLHGLAPHCGFGSHEPPKDPELPCRTRNQEMEMEPDSMESKSVTDLVKSPSSITIVRCRVDPDGKECTDRRGDGKEEEGHGEISEGKEDGEMEDSIGIPGKGFFTSCMFLPEITEEDVGKEDKEDEGKGTSVKSTRPLVGSERQPKAQVPQYACLIDGSKTSGNGLLEAHQIAPEEISHMKGAYVMSNPLAYPTPPPPSSPLPPIPDHKTQRDCLLIERAKENLRSSTQISSHNSKKMSPSQQALPNKSGIYLEVTTGINEDEAISTVSSTMTYSDKVTDSTNSDNVFYDDDVSNSLNYSLSDNKYDRSAVMKHSTNANSATADKGDAEPQTGKSVNTDYSMNSTDAKLGLAISVTPSSFHSCSQSRSEVTSQNASFSNQTKDKPRSKPTMPSTKDNDDLPCPPSAKADEDTIHSLPKDPPPPTTTHFLFQPYSPSFMGLLSASTLRGKIQKLPLYLSRSQETLSQAGVGNVAQSPAEDNNQTNVEIIISDVHEVTQAKDFEMSTTAESVESDNSDTTVTGSEVDEEFFNETTLEPSIHSVPEGKELSSSLSVQTEPKAQQIIPLYTGPMENTPGPITKPPASINSFQRDNLDLKDRPGPVKDASPSVSSQIVVTTQNLNGPGLPFHSQPQKVRQSSSSRPLVDLCRPIEPVSSGCKVFSICQDPSQTKTPAEIGNSPSLKSEFGCSAVLTSQCETVMEGMQLPLDACGCPPVYANCFGEGDSFDDELTVYEFSCRTQSSSLTQTSGAGLPLMASPPVPSFLSTSSTNSSTFPHSILFSSTSELSPLLSPLSDASDCFLSQTPKDTIGRLGQHCYPEPPAGFQVLRLDVDQLLSTLESSGVDRSVTRQAGRHPRDTCPAHFTENKRLLQLEARRLMSDCQKVAGIGQSPDEMLHSLAESFRTLVELAGICLWFSGCDRCDRRNAEAVAGLADVARSFRDFCLAAERASSKRSCQDLSAKLLAKQCTALTASVFCLTQLFRTLTAL
ncbi:FERM and PDZ domain-containing protein 1 [Antennarius striatus]|uniref:FERM and PDZ domain-containing protein 1 n=1 Tax=Antennarius striatus TaxID=241820 RepID=UPI0035B24A31